MRRRDTVAAWAVLGAVAFATLALGGSTRLTALASAALGLACAIPYLPSRRGFRQLPALLALIVVAVAATLVQLVPLPLELLAVLSPEKAALIRANANALGQPPGWSPISLEPSSTWTSLAVLVGYAGCASAAIRVGATTSGRRFLCRGLVTIATSVALIAIVHQVADAQTLFGIYAPKQLRGEISFLAPLMNPNHLAGFLAIATPIAIGLALSNYGARRLLWGAAAAICACTALLVQSRTGGVSLLVGVAVVLVFALTQPREARRTRKSDRANRTAVGLIFATLLVAGLVYFGRGVATEISQTRVDEITGEQGKLAVWRSATELLWEHKLVGVGRGAFEQGFTPRIHESRFRHSHVENEYLQAAIDWGIPVALFLLGLAVVAFRTAAKRASRSLIEAGLFAALVAAAIHHIADFAIELPGPALFVVVLFSALSREELINVSGRRRFPASAMRGLAVLAAAIAIVVASTSAGRGPRADSAELSQIGESGSRLKRALENWHRHPADYISAGRVADELRQAEDDRAFRVASRALNINPAHWQLHLTVARMLLQTTRPTQALGEYALAAQYGRDVRPIVSEMVRRFPQPSQAVRGLPKNEAAIGPVAVALRSSEAMAIGLAYFRQMTVAYPTNGRGHEELARFAYDRRQWLEAANAAKRALDLGRRSGAATAARSLLRADRAMEAAVLLDDVRADGGAAAATKLQSIDELKVLARARYSLKQPDMAIDAMERAIELRGAKSPESAPLYLYLSEMQEKLGRSHQADASREAAARVVGESLNDSPADNN